MRKLQKEAKEVGALVAKQQKTAEQLAEFRKHHEELESLEYQLQSEKKNLQQKVQQLEDTLAEGKKQVDALRKQMDEEVAAAEAEAKAGLNAAAMEQMQK